MKEFIIETSELEAALTKLQEIRATASEIVEIVKNITRFWTAIENPVDSKVIGINDGRLLLIISDTRVINDNVARLNKEYNNAFENLILISEDLKFLIDDLQLKKIATNGN